MLSDPPLLRAPAVQHVGTLDPADRQPHSYEGNGLSVSLHPEEWAHIARIGGHIWTLRRRDGQPLSFIDWHALTDADRDAVRTWAQARGWAQQQTVYRLSWHDPDDAEDYTSDFDTYDEALAESESVLDPDLDPREAITTHQAWRATADCPDTRVSRYCDPTDVLLALWLREQRPDVDGVWWADRLDPMRLSAPRGVLVRDLEHYVAQRQPLNPYDSADR